MLIHFQQYPIIIEGKLGRVNIIKALLYEIKFHLHFLLAVIHSVGIVRQHSMEMQSSDYQPRWEENRH